jgi:hypothetical protein
MFLKRTRQSIASPIVKRFFTSVPPPSSHFTRTFQQQRNFHTNATNNDNNSKNTNNNKSNSSNSEKIDFNTSSSSSKSDKTKKRIIIGACSALALVLLSEIGYQFMPELSAGNVWRKIVYGDPFRNYSNLIHAKVMYLVLPSEYNIKETASDSETSNNESEERIIFISAERKFHLVVPRNFVPLGLNIVEHSYMPRGHSSMSITDIIGNRVSVEWQRAAPLLTKIELSTHTPFQEGLVHIAHYFMSQLEEVMDDVHVQRIEYISTSNTAPKPIDPVPYFAEKGVKPQDLFVVVTKCSRKNESGWQGHIFSVHYPFVYRITVDLPESMIEFSQKHKNQTVDETTLDAVARSYTNVEHLKPIVKENFRHATDDPHKIGLQLRNQLLAIYYNSFHTVPEPKEQ